MRRFFHCESRRVRKREREEKAPARYASVFRSEGQVLLGYSASDDARSAAKLIGEVSRRS